MLHIPQGKQLENFMERVIRCLENLSEEPSNYKCLLNSGYELSRNGSVTTKPKSSDTDHKLHSKHKHNKDLGQ